MADESRNDALLRHFVSRAQQPKTLASGSGANPYVAVIPIIVRTQFDHPGYSRDFYPHSMADQIDASRMVRVSVSNPPSSCSNARRLNMASMGGAFNN